ncbi:RRQRL motif-containing zinc-binding protein [Actinacidiphila reveromycinica]|nr:RRQRL motif-containing zinc-binding protein [Streptomyces sp. SN-593]
MTRRPRLVDRKHADGFPTYTWKTAPDGLSTKDQLKSRGLRPGGPIVAQIKWRSKKRHGNYRHAWLYETDLALPKQPMTPAKWEAVGKALRARRICPECGVEKHYTISTKYKACNECMPPEYAAAA